MKNVLKLLVVVVVISSTSVSLAQTFGVKAGLNLSNMVYKIDDEIYSEEFELNPGFHAGVTAEFPIDDMFSFETGVLLSTKGFKTSSDEMDPSDIYSSDHKVNILYLDIPLTAKVLYNIGGVEAFGLFGPYIDFGLTGKSKYKSTDESTEEDIEWGSDKDLKRLDLGLVFGVGVEVKSVEIGVSYNLGLANIAPNDDYDFLAKNKVLAISVGYSFRRK
ncbi:MAG: outer membrane beta-barrel protein [Draconibacterium sp.]|nr:outer membrane beta-barrel protein [Draconibacterium sp.]